MRTARWMWRWRPARAVTRRRKGHARLDQGGGQDGVSVEPQAGGWRLRARRRRARHPRAAHELRVPAPGGGAVRGRAQAHRGLARARRNYWLGLAPRERMLAGCALLALAALCWLSLIEPALARAERARAELTRLRGEHRAGNIAGQRASRANRARPGDGSVAAPRPGAGRLAADVTAPGGWPLAPEPGGRAGRTLAALAADAAWASVAAAGPDRLAPHRCARRRVQAGRHGAGSTG